MSRRPARPFLVCGPDIHGIAVYYRCRTLATAHHMCRGMEKWWSIVEIVHAGTDLLRESKEYDRAARRRLAEVNARLQAATS